MPRIRTFLAIDIGPKIRAAAEAVQADLAATGADVNWVDPNGLHVTLAFLGEVDDRDLAGACRGMAAAAKKVGPFRLTVAGLGAFPTPRRPKVLWAGVTEGAEDLQALAAALEVTLSPLGLFRKEDRPYTPHLTLGRAKDEAAGQLLAPEIEKYETWTAGSAAIEEVVLYSSELRRGGPEYNAMGRAPLTGRSLREE